MCKGPVVGDRIAYSRTQRGVLYREHRDLLEEGRDDFSDKEGGAAEIDQRHLFCHLAGIKFISLCSLCLSNANA